jgi:hypothetical protein
MVWLLSHDRDKMAASSQRSEVIKNCQLALNPYHAFNLPIINKFQYQASTFQLFAIPLGGNTMVLIFVLMTSIFYSTK